ncbi:MULTISPECIES: prolyl oligopeptidase family protein [Paenarthrobacter]|uniref:Prolyl oligopeptidase family serine peptidase n=1 Tax=Paenarthrobacter ureafaciens TaxID=37931 RepID=A0AAX3EJT5_PAEUR|nr:MULTISPECIES: prolyl oligopeptidase family serine peptidase [Paenarthrobacter]NKR12451.1 prolyl oligopeptidase [Arthrobacter sp. M5]NKR14282.1 prolyl oligopeptidase [Arthrobacter sp. M6]OEH61278.1 prolyl oligopeptidase [Arthrobacter sp. D2]OEH64291.1 prolyl oligopeptidase [Arthrobacter sp. D4]MDO5863380.1 prolyl oligopeptidase family serine peptidase [Paenarthrobacter sp. SD-2]
MTTTAADQSPLPEEREQPGPRHADVAPEPTDEFVWLEDIHGEEQLAWVREQNARTEELLEDAGYAAVEAGILEVLDSTDRIAMVNKRGDFYYNFWKDREHPKGLWRRTTWESYLSDAPDWDELLDVDALAASEGIEWVFHGAGFLRPSDGSDYRLAMVSLSPDGGDANRYREFDLATRTFVDPADGGFDLPTAKGHVSWLDADTLLVSSTADGLPATSSSYARTAVKLRRGESLASAEQIFEIPEDHMLAMVAHDSTPGFERTFAVDYIDFYNQRTSLLHDGAWMDIDVPTDVNISAHREWLMFRPRHDWSVAGVQYPAGSLLAAGLEEWLAGTRDVVVLFTPDDHTSLQSWSWTRDYLLLNLLRDVSSEIRVLDPSKPDDSGSWAWSTLDACPPLHDVNAYAVDDEDESGAGNDYWLVATGFTTPTTLTRGSLGPAGSHHEEVKRSPSFFNEAGYEVQQHFAVSADGTRIPYFQVASKDLVLDGQNPTQLSGYGGFEVSRTPAYSGTIGRAWLERRTTGEDAHVRGGVYVVANIRGGGEYGPSWHHAALRENRHRAYEDFAAVAQDLISRGVTSRKRLGCVGGSNGGLLVGNMLTQYPELFGAISCGVPLLDMRRYTKLSAGYSWIAEYGDPDVPGQWEFIRTFSPYHLLRDGVEYPETFIWTATSDDRVGPVQARKMAARMQAMGIPNVWFHEALEGGHAGASDNRQAAALQARSNHFLWRALAGGE